MFHENKVLDSLFSIHYSQTMRLHRFFVAENIPEAGDFIISDAELTHQLCRVFRFTSGDDVIIFDGSGFDYQCEIISFGKEEVTFQVKEKKENKNAFKKEIHLFASLIKNSNYEWILEKCTELGVASFVPIISERSEKKNLNYGRAQKIIKEASEQSGRGMLPELGETCSLPEVFSRFSMDFIAFDSSGTNFRNYKLQITNDKENKIGILIGPEGGWSERELGLFKEKDIPVFSLGNQVLRAETAAIAVSSLVLL